MVGINTITPRNKFAADCLFKFMEAQDAAEARGEEAFECPICGSEAHWKRNDYNGHIRAWCIGCGMKVME